ncbi:Fimbrial adapter papK precursor [Serratia fonticola]|nr:fimbrial protein [Serratia fonticola]CAI1000446.1 Fimbrial adapter papK precursor [Serratia fonticola]CAI1194287.1 Fimbrial adapter papK precursor [Serratia fonticola]CAI1966399.1 Fimbrial adapter papK precursor [Serratia fonticola]CAI2001777.1 Fimbrial adapter papK precursor [Serratia fonticola]
MWLGMMGLSLLCSFAVQSADNLHFRGALVAEPCVIPPGEENIQLDFGTVIDKYLYLNQRTRGQQFAIHLAECDLTLGSTGVRITFRGNENLSLPGLLALDAASQASGIAIGIEAADGKPLPLNHAGHQYPLAKGSNLMVFKAYVEGEPEALANKTIQRGPFNAVATFSLDYE